MLDFFNYNLSMLADFLEDNLESRNHSIKIFKKFYREIPSPPYSADEISVSSKKLLKNNFYFYPLKIINTHFSNDGTVKFLFQLYDCQNIETVLMPEKNRITLCISSQVGCRQNCSFCYTGKMGLIRNLSSGEMVNQVYSVYLWLKNNVSWLMDNNYKENDKLSNIVFMGMGEPLDNIEAVINAIKTITDDNGFGIAIKKVSVSTSGFVPGLIKLRNSFCKIPIAVSLFSPFDKQRSDYMPINCNWNLKILISELLKYQNINNKFIFIQYTLIKGINDSLEHAKALVELLKPIKVRINLIPVNPTSKSLLPPEKDTIINFKNYLMKCKLITTIRDSNGKDIHAACGQLCSKKI